MSSEDRRAPNTTRIPFEGLVDVGGAMGPSFEAQAVNVSEDGILLRTAYLPEAGQPLTCRFDAAGGQSVLAAGEVVWTQGAERGGEFAIRFTDMDPESVDSLKRLCGVPAPGESAAACAPAGSKVRLHIEGLASPMRAKIRDSGSSAVTVGSDLGFLQVGKQLELEDATSGAKRPAAIDRVEVQIDPGSHVPQLVVTLRYSDAAGGMAESRTRLPAPAPAASPVASDDLRSMQEASAQMKGAVARSFALVGPALERFAQRARTTLAILAKRRSERAEDAAPRRTTAPAPGGGLHAEGKRVVRGSGSISPEEPAATPRLQITRRKAAIAGGVMAVAVLGAIVLKKTHHDPPADASATTAAAATEAAGAAGSAAVATTPPAVAPNAAGLQGLPPAPPPIDTSPTFGSPTTGPYGAADEPAETASNTTHKKHTKVTPFGSGAVHHGNVLHIKMDGPIESLEGAAQPTGFAVKIPGRKSLDAAAPLASRDSRIAAIKMANASAGAELTMAFKDGVPNYQVSAKGDTLIIALAPVGDTVTSKNDSSSRSAKHHKTDSKKSSRQ